MKVEEKVVTEKHYFLKWENREEDARLNFYDITRTADILFINGKFESCKYEVEGSKTYLLTDWQFLKIVADRILEIDKENKEAK